MWKCHPLQSAAPVYINLNLSKTILTDLLAAIFAYNISKPLIMKV